MPRKLDPPELENSAELADTLKQKFIQALCGYWHCADCRAACEREEGEQGQPAHCTTCGSVRILWVPPFHEEKKPEVA